MLSKKRKADLLQAYMFVLPAMVVIGVFFIFPIIYSFILSFYKVNLIGNYNTFIGFDNYSKLFKLPHISDFISIKNSFLVLLEAIFSKTLNFGYSLKHFFQNIIGLFVKSFKYKVALYNTIKYVIVVVPL